MSPGEKTLVTAYILIVTAALAYLVIIALRLTRMSRMVSELATEEELNA